MSFNGGSNDENVSFGNDADFGLQEFEEDNMLSNNPSQQIQLQSFPKVVGQRVNFSRAGDNKSESAICKLQIETKEMDDHIMAHQFMQNED